MMTVLRLHYGDEQALDVRPSDVAKITTTANRPSVVVEVDAGPKSDNYSYLASRVEPANRTSDTDIPLQ